jgi:hypothetical protein
MSWLINICLLGLLALLIATGPVRLNISGYRGWATVLILTLTHATWGAVCLGIVAGILKAGGFL